MGNLYRRKRSQQSWRCQLYSIRWRTLCTSATRGCYCRCSLGRLEKWASTGDRQCARRISRVRSGCTNQATRTRAWGRGAQSVGTEIAGIADAARRPCGGRAEALARCARCLATQAVCVCSARCAFIRVPLRTTLKERLADGPTR